jgi:hypothetical protein
VPSCTDVPVRLPFQHNISRASWNSSLLRQGRLLEQSQYESGEKTRNYKRASLETERYYMGRGECSLQTFLGRYGLMSLIRDVISGKSLDYFVRNGTL